MLLLSYCYLCQDCSLRGFPWLDYSSCGSQSSTMVLVHLEDHMTGPIEQSGSCSQLNSNHNDQPSQNGDHSEECCHCAHGDDHDHHEHVEPCHHDRTGHNHSDNNSTGNNQQEPSPSIAHAPEEPFSRVVGFMDIAGVFASTLCAVHLFSCFCPCWLNT